MSRSNKIRSLSKLYLDCKKQKAKNEIVNEIIRLNHPFTVHFAKRSGVLDKLDDFEQNFAMFLLRDFNEFDPDKGDVFKFLVKVYYKAQNATLKSSGVMGWVPENYYKDPINKLGRTQRFKEIKTRSLDEITYNEDTKKVGAKSWMDFLLVEHVDNENRYETILQKAITANFITNKEKLILDKLFVLNYDHDSLAKSKGVTRQAIEAELMPIIKKLRLFLSIHYNSFL